MFTIVVRSSFGHVLEETDDSLFGVFETLQQAAPDALLVDVILRPRSRLGNTEFARVLDRARRLLQHDQLQLAARTFTIHGRCNDSGRPETIDLLKIQLTSTKQIARMSDRGRALDHDSAFGAIEEAYSEIASEIDVLPNIES